MLQPIFFPEVPQEMPDGSVAGPDMEYALPFIALRASAVVQAERQVGDSILVGKGPDWAEVFTAGASLLMQTRDLRVLVTLLCAAVHRHGLPALAEGLELMADWLQRFWDDVHPRLEVDGEFDPLMRSNAVAELADPAGLLGAVRAASFMETALGVVSVADVEKIMKGVPSASCPIQSQSELRSAAQTEAQRNAGTFDAIQRACSALGQIAGAMRERLAPDFWPELAALEWGLSSLRSCVPSVAEKSVPEAEGGKVPEARPALAEPVDTATPVARPGRFLPEELLSRDEAFKALRLARLFFEKNEPSHPATFLIKRIEDLQGKDFFALVQELLPDGMGQLRVLAGLNEE